MKLVIKNLEQLVQVCDDGQQYKCGKDQNIIAKMERREDGCGCFMAVDDSGLIQSIGFDDELPDVPSDCKVIDGKGCSLIPGLVDSHTHPVWAGDRLFEFELKMAGASYLDIHAKGGGIYFTVDKTREASEEELLQLFKSRLNQFLSHGTTVLEAKTGYGLDFATEHKMLQVIGAAMKDHPVEIVTNLLAGHAVPKGCTPEEGTDQVINLMSNLKKCSDIPAIEFVDVFCEKGVFDVDQSRRILQAGKDMFKADIAFHGEELCCLSSAELAAEMGAKSISHCEFISDTGIASIAKSKTVAIICPTTAFLLRLEPPPVRKMIDSGVIVAVASDFNPNAYCLSLIHAMQLAVIHCKLTLNEALTGATINAAFALNRSGRSGSLQVGKWADMLLLATSDWRNLIYQMSQSRDLIKAVVKKGQIVYQNGDSI